LPSSQVHIAKFTSAHCQAYMRSFPRFQAHYFKNSQDFKITCAHWQVHKFNSFQVAKFTRTHCQVCKFTSLHDPHIDKLPSFSSLQVYPCTLPSFSIMQMHIAKLSKFTNAPSIFFSFL